MASKDAFASYCAELLSDRGSVRVRRMFGGHGIYVDELFVAIVIGETLYLKTDAETTPRFVAAGCVPFTYSASGNKRVSLSYHAVPAEAMDSAASMRPWAELAIQAALRARTRKRSGGAGRKPR